MPIRLTCTKCGKVLRVQDALAGRRVRCPGCSTILPVPAADAASDAPAPAASPVPAPAAPPPPADPPANLPPSMLANKLVAGRVCPACDRAVGLGEAVNNCQACGATHHASCWTEAGGCAGPDCPASPRRAEPAAPTAAAPAGPTKPCPLCGEPISEAAKKCRHCGEWLDPKIKKAVASEAGETLTVAEWIFGILCSGIACIVSIVWMIQGKPKGKKLFLIALVSQLALGMLRFLLVEGRSRG